MHRLPATAHAAANSLCLSTGSRLCVYLPLLRAVPTVASPAALGALTIHLNLAKAQRAPSGLYDYIACHSAAGCGQDLTGLGERHRVGFACCAIQGCVCPGHTHVAVARKDLEGRVAHCICVSAQVHWWVFEWRKWPPRRQQVQRSARMASLQHTTVQAGHTATGC